MPNQSKDFRPEQNELSSNSSELDSRGFSKSFGLELITFPGFCKQNYTMLN